MNERLVYDFYNECTFSETLSSEGTLRPERATRSYGLIQTFNRTGSLIQTLIPFFLISSEARTNSGLNALQE